MVKNITKRLTIFILIFAAILTAAAFFVTFANVSAGTAFAADGVSDYIKAPVSDLEKNSVAGVSSLPLRDVVTDEIIFYVPESYYVTVEGHSSFGFYTVSYMDFTTKFHISDSDLNGLTPAAVTFETGVSPYPNQLINLIADSEITLNGVKLTSESGYTIKYAGGTDSAEMIFVKADKDDSHYRGAVPKSAFIDFAVPYHKITEEERNAILESKKPGGSVTSPASQTSDTLRIIIIIGIAIPAVLIVFLIFRPGKNKNNNYDKRVMKGGNRASSRNVDYDRGRAYGERNDGYDSRYGNDRRNGNHNYSGRDNYNDGYPRDDRYNDNRYRDSRYDNRDYPDDRDDNRGYDNRNYPEK